MTTTNIRDPSIARRGQDTKLAADQSPKWPCGNHGNRPLLTPLQLGPQGSHFRFVRAELFPPRWALENLIALHHGGPQVLVQLEHKNIKKNIGDLDISYTRVASKTHQDLEFNKVCLLPIHILCTSVYVLFRVRTFDEFSWSIIHNFIEQ